MSSTITIKWYSVNNNTVLPLSNVGGISAGFPSPAEDWTKDVIDLNKQLIKNPTSTFYGRVTGNSMEDIGIHDGDLLVVDKSIEPSNKHIVVACLDGEFTMKRIIKKGNKVFLKPENKNYPTIEITESNRFMVWGVVMHVIKTL